MNILTELIRFDALIAICAVLLRDGDTEIKVYASSLASETPFFADLAQKRAIQLALGVQAKGADALLGLSYSEHVFRQANASPTASEPFAATLPLDVEDIVSPLSQPDLDDEPGIPPATDFSDEAPW